MVIEEFEKHHRQWQWCLGDVMGGLQSAVDNQTDRQIKKK